MALITSDYVAEPAGAELRLPAAAALPVPAAGRRRRGTQGRSGAATAEGETAAKGRLSWSKPVSFFPETLPFLGRGAL